MDSTEKTQHKMMKMYSPHDKHNALMEFCLDNTSCRSLFQKYNVPATTLYSSRKVIMESLNIHCTKQFNAFCFNSPGEVRQLICNKLHGNSGRSPSNKRKASFIEPSKPEQLVSTTAKLTRVNLNDDFESMDSNRESDGEDSDESDEESSDEESGFTVPPLAYLPLTPLEKTVLSPIKNPIKKPANNVDIGDNDDSDDGSSGDENIDVDISRYVKSTTYNHSSRYYQLAVETRPKQYRLKSWRKNMRTTMMCYHPSIFEMFKSVPGWTYKVINYNSPTILKHFPLPNDGLGLLYKAVYMRPGCTINSDIKILNEDYFFNHDELFEFFRFMVGLIPIPRRSEKQRNKAQTTPASTCSIEVSKPVADNLESAVEHLCTLVNKVAPPVNNSLSLGACIHSAKLAFRYGGAVKPILPDISDSGKGCDFIRRETLLLYEIVCGSLTRAEPTSIFLWGSPGQGKTRAVDCVIAQLLHNFNANNNGCTDYYMPNFNVVSMRACNYIFETLLDRLGLAKKEYTIKYKKDNARRIVSDYFMLPGLPCDVTYVENSANRKESRSYKKRLTDCLSSTSKSHHPTTILFLDELSFCQVRDVAELLHTIDRNKNCSVVLIATCNDSPLSYQTRLNRESLQPVKFQHNICFPRYKKEDIKYIIDQRSYGLFDDFATRYLIARCMAKHLGDIRKLSDECSLLLDKGEILLTEGLFGRDLLESQSYPFITKEMLDRIFVERDIASFMGSLTINAQLLLVAMVVNDVGYEYHRRFHMAQLVDMFLTEGMNVHIPVSSVDAWHRVRTALDELKGVKLVEEVAQTLHRVLIRPADILKAGDKFSPVLKNVVRLAIP